MFRVLLKTDYAWTRELATLAGLFIKHRLYGCPSFILTSLLASACVGLPLGHTAGRTTRLLPPASERVRGLTLCCPTCG